MAWADVAATVPPVTTFDTDTALTELEPGRHEVQINRNWWIVAGPNGGLLAAQFLAAACAVVDDRPVRTMTVHYAAPPVEGSATIETIVERRGRSAAFLRQRMEQDGKLVASTLVAIMGAKDSVAEWNELAVPDVAAPDDCPVMADSDASIPLRGRWDMRWTAGVPGRPSNLAQPGEVVVGGWTRLSEDQPLDQRVLAAMSDAWIPPAMIAHHGRFAAPTIELTIHFRAGLAPEFTQPGAWCHALFRSPVVSEGYVDEVGEIWSADGRLLVQSRQISLLIPLPDMGDRDEMRWEMP